MVNKTFRSTPVPAVLAVATLAVVGLCSVTAASWNNALGKPAISVSTAPSSITRGGTATVTFKSNQTVSAGTKVYYDVSGSAVRGTDYTLSVSSPVTISSGASSATVLLSALTGKGRTATLAVTANSAYAVGTPANASVVLQSAPTPTPTPSPTATPTPTATPSATPTATPTPTPTPAYTPPLGYAAPDPSNSVWIASRTDGVGGSGTESDPYDGSTAAKFDSLMAAIPVNTHVYIGSGTFQTKGDASWYVKDGWWIEGAGMGNTILQKIGVTGAEVNQPAVIGGGNGTENIRLSDLTLDCNGSAIPPNSLSRALGSYAKCALIENVEAKNFGHYQNASIELFGFGVTSPYSSSRGWMEMRNCQLHDLISPTNACTFSPTANPIKVKIAGDWRAMYSPNRAVIFSSLSGGSANSLTAKSLTVNSVNYTGGNTVLSIAAGSLSDRTSGQVAPLRLVTMVYAQGQVGRNPQSTFGGLIELNDVFFPGQFVIGFGDSGWDGVDVRNNTVQGGFLFNFDTGDSNNVTFENNITHSGGSTGGYCGVVGGGYRWNNWNILGNTFYLNNWMNQGLVVSPQVNEIEISDNWFYEETTADWHYVPILNITGTNMTLLRNHFSPSFSNFIAGNAFARDNVYLNGTLIPIAGNISSGQ